MIRDPFFWLDVVAIAGWIIALAGWHCECKARRDLYDVHRLCMRETDRAFRRQREILDAPVYGRREL